MKSTKNRLATLTLAITASLSFTGCAIVPGVDQELITKELSELTDDTATVKMTDLITPGEPTTIEIPLDEGGDTPLPDTRGKADEPADEQTTDPADDPTPDPADNSIPEPIDEPADSSPEVAETPADPEPDPAENTDEGTGDEEPVYIYPYIPDAVGGEGGMTGEILDMAYAIFDEYNAWRANHGLNTCVWDGRCADMAVACAGACAAQERLQHQLGVPFDVQDRYSDILMLSSWKIDPAEAITRWENSDGHRRMMQCPTARNAACGIAIREDSQVYYIAIVYSFDGCNQWLD